MSTREPPGRPPGERRWRPTPWHERGASERAAAVGPGPPPPALAGAGDREPPTPSPRPQPVPHWRRLREIGRVFARHGLGALAWRLGLVPHRPWRDYLRVAPRLWGGAPMPGRPWPDAVREALVELGPAFVKAGQILSVRADLVPAELAEALRALQSDVPPEPFAAIRRAVERELGCPLEVAFKRFETRPIAAASIAQVHQAWLPDGTHVAVKVKRPGIDPVVMRDLENLLWLAAKAERDWPAARPYRPLAAARELAEYTRRELDFQNEARVATRLRAHFRDWPTVYIPSIHRCTHDLIVMDFIAGTPIDQWALRADREARDRMLRTTAACFNEQILILGLFHADPHPGNLHVTPDGYLAILDFGIFGEIDEPTRRSLALTQIAMARGEYNSSVRILLRLAEIEPGGDPIAYRRQVAAFYRAWQRANVAEYGFGRLVFDVVGAGARHGVIFPPEVILYGKAMATLEGVAIKVVPDVNLADISLPNMEALAAQLMGPEAMQRTLRRAMPILVDLIDRLPTDGATRIMRELDESRSGPPRPARQEAPQRRREPLPAIAAMGCGAALMVAGVGPALEGLPVFGALVLALGLAWGWHER